MMTPLFIDEIENEGHNIVYKINKDNCKREIHFISIDLLLKKIALENLSEDNSSIIDAIVLQYHLFIEADLLIQKVINFFDYFKNKSKEISKKILIF